MSDQAAPLREIQPVVVPEQYFVTAPFAAAFGAVFIGFPVFFLSNMMSRDHFTEQTGYGWLAFGLAWLGLMYLQWMQAFVQPGKTCYKIFRDRIEYSEGLWTREQRTIILDKVIDVLLTEGIFQQRHGAGTIVLVTQQLVTDSDGNVSQRRYSLTNIPAPQETYDLLRTLSKKPEAIPE